ncbi:MAG: glycosyltransferase, partial [Desulfobacterales bacterium]|nr:glycosyltransferase [Desulfobacterales bacterium]
MSLSPQPPDLISVIIPTLDEADNIGPLLEDVFRARGVEVIVVDGGSRDQTAEVACKQGALVITGGPPGRALQMNQGAAAARGRLLFFLHADSRLPKGFDDLIRRALAVDDAAAGA